MLHKKQLYNLVCDIAKLNNDVWDNPKHSFDNRLASSMLIEESIETFDVSALAEKLGLTPTTATHKSVSRAIVELLIDTPDTSSTVDQLDKILDTIYIAVGELHKLGLNPDQMVDALQIVHDANTQKSNTKDSEGKVIKPKDFEKPEPKLQLILDKCIN